MTALQQRWSLYIGGILTTGILWYFGAYTPAAKNLSAARYDIEQSQRQLDEYNHMLRELPDFLARNNRLEQARSRLNSSLYAKNEILELFQQLTEDAQANGLKLIQISPPLSELLELNHQATLDNAPLFLNLTLDLRGRYLDFGRFVTDLENKSYFRSFRTCTVRGKQAGEPTVDISLSFKALLGTGEAAT